ncbi:mannosyltransferase [Rhodotorula sphaerocarpa]
MCYHADSLARHGFETRIVAHRGSKPPQTLLNRDHVRFDYLETPLPWISALPKPLFLLFAPLKILLGAIGLYRTLASLRPAPAFLLVQNPPAIPTLAVVKTVAFFSGSRVVIDWHNTGYSVLALRLGADHKAVSFARSYEHFFGRTAHAHLCVSDAMRSQLLKEARLKGTVVTLHDRPPASFRRLAPHESHELFGRLPSLVSLNATTFANPDADPAATLLTDPDGRDLPDRPALVVSSTSWTADEDFGILLDALSEYERVARLRSESSGAEGGKLRKVVVVITGKGAGKRAFEEQVAVRERDEKWESVRVRTEWLEREDYPRLLGSADLGISLHTSTSGIDLPMKVVDMFGCGLPVVALDFACIGELVQDGRNGRTFKDSAGLAQLLVDLLPGTSPRAEPNAPLDRLRDGIRTTRYGGEGHEAPWDNWDENWDRVVLPLLRAPRGVSDARRKKRD